MRKEYRSRLHLDDMQQAIADIDAEGELDVYGDIGKLLRGQTQRVGALHSKASARNNSNTVKGWKASAGVMRTSG
jgi:hypothetical protein